MKENEVLICACHSSEHQWLIRQLSNEEIYIHAHLIRSSFWYRLKYGIRYIFGYKCRYGAWDEIILTDEHAAQFQDLADRLKKLNSEQGAAVCDATEAK